MRVLSASTKPVYLKHSWNNRLPLIPSGVAGVVCGNTLPFRGGGLSGDYCRAYNVRLTQLYQNETLVIGCGGVRGEKDYGDYMNAGAERVQIGSAFRQQFMPVDEKVKV